MPLVGRAVAEGTPPALDGASDFACSGKLTGRYRNQLAM